MEAKLPVKYSQARQALAECERIDECKDWSDKAQALASYARQAKDTELVNHAMRIQARAVRRAGELLESIEPQIGGDRKSNGGHLPLDTRTSVAREAGMSEHQQKTAIRIARIPEDEFESKVESDTPPTLTALSTPHVEKNSGNNEWYTPPEIINCAKLAMGGIDLDPASSHEANKIVGANMYYTKEDNGIGKAWMGRVWLNPPYAMPLISEFVDTLIDNLPNITCACVLVNNATETAWGQKLLEHCDMVVFPKGRIKYLDDTLEPKNTPLQGQMIVLFHTHAIEDEWFESIGQVFNNF